MLRRIYSALLHETDFLTSVRRLSFSYSPYNPYRWRSLRDEVPSREQSLSRWRTCCERCLFAMMVESCCWLIRGSWILGNLNFIFSLISRSICLSSLDFCCLSRRIDRLRSFNRCLAAELTKQQLACGSASALQVGGGEGRRSKGRGGGGGRGLRCIIKLWSGKNIAHGWV